VIRQLAFDLPANEARTRADFLVAPSNALALEMLDGTANWPQARLILVGPEGSGKTHLAHVWATETGANLVQAEVLAGSEIDRLASGPVALDNADRLAGDAAGEAALFHLLNFMGTKRPLLMTARTPPRDWGIALPDLFSRLQAAPIATLAAPDDALLSAVLVKLFTDRQVAVAANLIPYLVSRMPRQISAAQDLVAALDARALAEGRPITRQLAGDVLDRLSQG
jgi:chromosomal replication initiation ATPase DnaA